MTNNEYVKEQREGAQSSPSSGLLFPRSSILWAHVPLKSHADVIYVFKLDASTAHPPPRIFACEDCTAPPVRRWREEMWGGDCWEDGGGAVKEQYVSERNSYSSVCSQKLAGHHKPQSAEYIMRISEVYRPKKCLCLHNICGFMHSQRETVHF